VRCGALALAALALVGGNARADPLRLRGDALAAAQAPAGLLVLSADQRTGAWLDAEALVWLGAGTAQADDAAADALVVSVAARDPAGRGTIRVGRFVATAGALMPSHLDGAHARVRLPAAFELEGFGGLAVVPHFGPRAYDWLAGGRVARRFGTARAGVGYLERRDARILDRRELAADAWLPLGPVELAGAAAWDAVGAGLASLDVVTTYRRRRARFEVYARHRSPAHLLPATSLFSVLGDAPARQLGGRVSHRLAPRLDVSATAGLRRADGELDEELAAEARLRLDERGTSAVSLGLRRQGSPDGSFTGGRGAARVALGARLGVATELELAVPDDPRGRGAVWPWALAALTLKPGADWEVAAGLEASASPAERGRFDALVRVSQVWSTR
jgi:hypothetical protein